MDEGGDAACHASCRVRPAPGRTAEGAAQPPRPPRRRAHPCRTHAGRANCHLHSSAAVRRQRAAGCTRGGGRGPSLQSAGHRRCHGLPRTHPAQPRATHPLVGSRGLCREAEARHIVWSPDGTSDRATWPPKEHRTAGFPVLACCCALARVCEPSALQVSVESFAVRCVFVLAQVSGFWRRSSDPQEGEG